MGVGNVLDKAVASIAPTWALSRAKSRARLDSLSEYREQRSSHMRALDAASVSRRTRGWMTTGNAPHREYGPQLHRVRNRSRDLTANNKWATKAISVLDNRTVGRGIAADITADDTATEKRAQELWQEFATTTACDAEGRNNLDAILGLTARELYEAGEGLIRRRTRRISDGFPVPLQLQALEPDHIHTVKHEPRGKGGVIVQGVQYSAMGRVEGYWLLDSHPGGDFVTGRGLFTSRYQRREDVIHVFEDLRIGQVRGIPRPTAVVIGLKDYDGYEDAQQARLRAASMLVGFVRDIDIGDAAREGGIGKKTELDQVVEMEPMTWEFLPPGKSIEFARPPGMEGAEDFARLSLRGIAAGYRLSYESLTGDLSQVNFSSGRLGRLDFKSEMEKIIWRVFIPQVVSRVWGWFLEAARDAGIITGPVQVQWTPPRFELTDPVREGLAMLTEVQAGFRAPQEVIRMLGGNPERVVKQIAEFLKMAEDQGLDLTSVSGATDPKTAVSNGGTSGRSNGRAATLEHLSARLRALNGLED